MAPPVTNDISRSGGGGRGDRPRRPTSLPPGVAWSVERRAGGAGTLHSLGVPDASAGRLVRVLSVDRPALVLGSTQPASVVRDDVAIDVVRRASGGGAVLVEPGRVVWVDVFVPADDPLWCRDVGRAFWWLGEMWAEALAALGVGDAVVHRGPLVTTPWSSAVCFAGLGSGEVTVGGRKTVGMAQRRTRDGALFQCAVPLAWSAASIVALLDLPPEAADDLAAAVHPLDGVAEADVVSALLTTFGHRQAGISA